MTGAVEKVAAAIDLDAIWDRGIRARGAIAATGLDNLTAAGLIAVGLGITDDIPALIAEVKRLRVENLTYQQLADHSERIIGELTERAEAAEARNAAALDFHKPYTPQFLGMAMQPRCGSCDVPHPCTEWIALGGETATTQEGAFKAPSAAVEPRSGGERGNGRAADSDTAESQEAS